MKYVESLEEQRRRIYEESIQMTNVLNMMLTYKNNFQYAHLEYWELQRTIDTNYHKMKKEMEREVENVRDAIRNISVQDYDLQLKLKALKGEMKKCDGRQCDCNEDDNNPNN